MAPIPPNRAQVAATSYFDRAGKALLGSVYVFDYAVSAEKMMDWSCIGEDNEAWTNGPFLSAGANAAEIDRSRPYCMALSLEASVATSLVLGSPNKAPGEKGVRIPIEMGSREERLSEPIIAKLTIIEQFELYKELALEIGGPTNRKSMDGWRGRIDDIFLDELVTLTDRRNELTHESNASRPTMKEAIEYYGTLKWIAEALVERVLASRNS